MKNAASFGVCFKLWSSPRLLCWCVLEYSTTPVQMKVFVPLPCNSGKRSMCSRGTTNCALLESVPWRLSLIVAFSGTPAVLAFRCDTECKSPMTTLRSRKFVLGGCGGRRSKQLPEIASLHQRAASSHSPVSWLTIEISTALPLRFL